MWKAKAAALDQRGTYLDMQVNPDIGFNMQADEGWYTEEGLTDK